MRKPTTVSLLKKWWYWYSMEHQLILRQPSLAYACFSQRISIKSSIVASYDVKTGLSTQRSARKRAWEMLQSAQRWSPALRFVPILSPSIIQPMLTSCRNVTLTDVSSRHAYAWSQMLKLIYARRRQCAMDMMLLEQCKGDDSDRPLALGEVASQQVDELMSYFEHHPQLLTEGRPFLLLSNYMKAICPHESASLIERVVVFGQASAPQQMAG